MAVDKSSLPELRRVGVVRAAADPLVAMEVVAAGVAALEEMLPNGGLPIGFISEVRGGASSGRLTIAVRVVLRALEAGERAAFVTSPLFFPGLTPGLAAALDGALFVRVACLEDGIAAAEVLATTGSVDLLVVDVVGLHCSEKAKLPDATLARLERAARSERVAVLMLMDETSSRLIGLGAKAAIRVELRASDDTSFPDGASRPIASLDRSRFRRALVRDAVPIGPGTGLVVAR